MLTYLNEKHVYQIRRTVREEPWFLETVEEYARATIEASGLPIRMQTQEQASQQVGFYMQASA
jgi:hypothetical protein